MRDKLKWLLLDRMQFWSIGVVLGKHYTNEFERIKYAIALQQFTSAKEKLHAESI